MSLFQMLASKPVDFDTVSSYLDSLDSDARIAELRTIPGRLQQRLFELAEGKRPLSVDHFVPSPVPDKAWIRHYGRNSLPMFSDFEKRFARPRKGARELWGYNHSPAMGVVGPGYFVLRKGADKAGELDIDYYRTPPAHIEGGPKITSNTFGLSFFVYGKMVDVMRGVSEHVTVGRAYKFGEATNNYFLLCRQEIIDA